MHDAGKRESDAVDQAPPKIKAADNPWYLLATLYGVPKAGDDELRAKNRVAWNRYFAANLYEEARTKLIEEKRHPAEELRPFSPEESREVATAFAERSKVSAKKPALPASNAYINFSNIDFEHGAFLIRYLFSGEAYFKGATFSGEAFFEGATFSGEAFFDGATFSVLALFYGATFSGEAYFKGATFSAGALFGGATFSGRANFGGATFSAGALFGDASFSGLALFNGATFSGPAYFGDATFSAGAFFGDASFSGRASFSDATLSGEAFFNGATFSGWANFNGATFSTEANFRTTTFGEGSSFVNAEMKGLTSFERAKFEKEPPRFFGAKLHQGTVWRGINWPLPKNKNEAGAFIDAYACLRLEMDRLKKHDDELDFFALEMASRRALLGPVRRLPMALYGLLSGYGRSYLRPLGALFVVAAIGAGAFWYFDARTYGEALGFSVASTLNVFGFRRDFNLAIDTPVAWLEVFAAVQTICGTILLFLFGLGIRNRFRMK